MPDSSAAAPRSAASRWATTTSPGPGAPGPRGDDVDQVALAVDRLAVEAVAAHGARAERRAARRRRAAASRVVGRVAGPARREARAASVVERRAGAVAVEGVGRERRPDRPRAVLERERRHEQREQHGHERGAVEARVEHPPTTVRLQRADAWCSERMAERAPRILLADDEQSIQTLLSYPLHKDGYEVVQAADGREALARFGESAFDLVVLDVMMPRIDGLEVCRRLRARTHGPDHHAHRQGRGDRQGPRPRARRRRLHHQAVLAARVPLPREGRAAPRRRCSAADERRRRAAADASTSWGSTPAKRAVRVRGEAVELTFVEFEILAALAARPGRVFTRDMLLTRIWGDSAYRDPRTIDVHIRHLREKLERDAKDPEYLFTVRGVGLPLPRRAR